MAEIEIQFNWVLILVAGALIFLFFFGIIRWVQTGAETSRELKISGHLDSVMTGASVAESTVNVFTLPGGDIEFTCESYRLGDTTKSINNKIVFAPSHLRGGEMVSWVKSWNIPFRVANFLYLTSPQLRYIVLGDPLDPLYIAVKDILPSELLVEYNPSTISDQNHFKVRFIYINPASFNPQQAYLNNFKGMDTTDVTAAVIYGALPGNMDISFYRKTHPSVSPARWISDGNSKAFGEASLLGGIFADTSADYDCSMQRGFDRLVNIASIYRARTTAIHTEYSGSNPGCAALYSGASTTYIQPYGTATYADLPGLYNSIVGFNQLAQQSSCALIY